MLKKEAPVEQYDASHGCKINSNCDVQFNRKKDKKLHIRINTFGDTRAVLTEESFLEVIDAYHRYKNMDHSDERKA